MAKTKDQLFDQIEQLTQGESIENLIRDIIHWFDSAEIEDFIEYMEQERGY